MKTPKPLGNALRLEVQSDPAAGQLVNLVANPNGDLGGWGWLTPVGGSTMARTTVGTDSALQYTSAGTLTNTVRNPSAEVDTNLYSVSNLSLARNTVWSKAGANSVTATTIAAGNSTYVSPQGPTSAPANRHACVSGDHLYARVSLMGLRSCAVRLAFSFYDAAGASTGPLVYGSYVSLTDGATIDVEGSTVVPTNAATTNYQPILYVYDDATGRNPQTAGAAFLRFDAFLAVNTGAAILPTVPAYFDGATPDTVTGGLTTDYAWTGTAHASTSTRTYTATGVPAGASYFTTENLACPAGQWVAATINVPTAPVVTWRLRFEWLDITGALLSSSAQSGYGATAWGPLQAPASTAYVRLRVDLYKDTGGANPAAGHTFVFNRATVAVAATSAALGSSRTNLLPNPSFETDLSGWTVTYQLQALRVTTEHQHGAAALSLTPNATTTRTNLVSNPSAETNVTGWASGGGSLTCSIARNTTAGYSGSSSVGVTRTGTAGTMEADYTPVLSVTPTLSYTVAASARAVTTGRTWSISVDWQTSAGAYISTSNRAGSDTTTGWSRTYAIVTAPANAERAVLRFQFNGCAVGEVHLLDAVMFEAATLSGLGPGDYLVDYYDGSTPAAGDTTYSWTGTAHASTSKAVTKLWSPANAGVMTNAKLPVTPNLDYTVSAYVKGSDASTGPAASVWFQWRDAANAIIAETYAPAGVVSPGWGSVFATATAPPAATGLNTGIVFDSWAPSRTIYVDSVMVEQSSTLNPFIVGTVTTGTLPYIPPIPFINVLGPTHDLTITRESLNVGTLVAHIVDAALDPSQTPALRPGRACRLIAFSTVTNTWQYVFSGQVQGAQVDYELAEPEASKRVRIELTAVDAAKTLANTKRSNGVATIDELPDVLEGAGVPWNVNGSGAGVPGSTTVATNDNASALDQVAVTRDSVLGYAWVDRAGVLQAWDRSKILARPSVGALTETAYNDVRTGYNTADLINEVTIKFLRLNPDDNTTDTIDYGPYRNDPSILQWGVSSAEFTIQGIAEETADLKEYADAVLVANSTPAVKLNTMRLTVDLAADWSGVPSASWYAFLDLYDNVTVSCARASIANAPMRVRGITHTISGPDSLWTMDVDFAGDVVASPSFIPTPTVGGEGKTIGELLRPVGEVTMWFGQKSAIPAGWLPCDGSPIPAEYTELKALLLAAGLSGTLTPNFTDVFPIGAGTKNLGTSGGTPSHTHNLDGSFGWAKLSWSAAGQALLRRITVASWTSDVATGATAVPITANTIATTLGISLGGRTDVPNDGLNPWRSVWFIIRAR